MKKILFLILIVFSSCSSVRNTEYGLKIRGETTINIFTDKSLKDISVIQGFVYSRLDSSFIEHAAITIDKELKIGTLSDKNGFFKYEVQPGLYSIECFCVSHVPEKTKVIKVNKGQNIIVFFELGTDINID